MQSQIESAKPKGAVAPLLDGLDASAVSQLLERVLTSQTFQRSPQLRKFLRYVTQAVIDGAECPSEQLVGVHALGRPLNYSPNDDNIVRVQARLLRQKLDAYFDHESPQEPWRISIPKGAYLPRFSPQDQMQESGAPPTVDVPEPPPAPSRRPRWLLATVIATVIATAVAATLVFAYPRPDLESRFWAQILNSSRQTLLIPTDSSLVVLQDITRQTIPLAEYAGQEYWNSLTPRNAAEGETFREVSRRRLTSNTSARLAMRLAQRPESASAHLELLNGRDLKAEKLDRTNLVLVGADHSNPWVAFFAPLSRIRITYERKHFDVQWQQPGGGIERLHQIHPTDPVRPVVGLISLLPNGNQGSKVLLIQGTGAEGTEAASDYVFQNPGFPQFLARIARNGEVPYFDLLVESNNIGGSTPTARISKYEVLPYR